MTQSGQGAEPSARAPREGVVLPSDGGAPLVPGEQPGPAPAGGQAWDQPWVPDPSAAQPWSAQGQPPAAAPLPPEGAQAPSYGAHPPAYGAQAYGAPAGAGLPPQQMGHMPPAVPGGPLPPVAEAATQYIPPVPAGPVDQAAHQYHPPVAGAPGSVDEAATQYIPPVGPGALPPEAAGTPESPSDATRNLGRVRASGPASGPGAGPLPTSGYPDAQATQYLPPVPAQQQPGTVPPQPYGNGAVDDRGNPDVFDNLFRSEPGGASAEATQQLPQVPHRTGQDQWSAQAPAAPHAAGGRAAGRRDAEGGRARTGSRVPMIAAVGVGIAVLGVGAGALLGTSGGGDEEQDPDRTVAAVASEAAESPSPTVDPAKEQAVALDKLLADSGSSRESVIRAVQNIKGCDNLQQAGTDLLEAAEQRKNLVTRLSQLSVDKLPNHAALTTALTKAWQASESADNHYAAWAGETAKKKGCHKGQARTTHHTQAGNTASGTASAEKEQAAKLWNAIASTYGLTQRQATQL
ncbi:hypothetical protein [Streptomyces poonensis]|uniref:Uncharacterized protein n=1 Tax=Streptomyces poonensis TaxID=68255 RepID=A0A918UE71_9ACTN|nr:hypothetical protein [Streptomyces poonensis]GGY94654.1 hypothetical protein GCM10010365_11750 [Streptomyces poonensis]